MRVGFVTQLLWQRYGEFWRSLVSGAGAVARLPVRDQVLDILAGDRLNKIPGVAFRLAVAQALSLHDVDTLIVPELNAEEGATRGSAQDPWIADFPGALSATFGGLPRIVGVPAKLAPDLEPRIVGVLHRISHDSAQARRVWQQHRGLLERLRTSPPSSKRHGSGATTAVVGQPWLFSGALLKSLTRLHSSFVSQHQLDAALLTEEGSKVGERLIDTDREVLGAARLFGRRGSIEQIVMVVDETSGSDVWLKRQIERRARKAVTVLWLSSLGAPEQWLGPCD